MRFKFCLKSLQLFFVLYGSVVQDVLLVLCCCSVGIPGCFIGVLLFPHCSGLFCYSTGVPSSIVSCSGVPSFIVCLGSGLKLSIDRYKQNSYLSADVIKAYTELKNKNETDISLKEFITLAWDCSYSIWRRFKVISNSHKINNWSSLY